MYTFDRRCQGADERALLDASLTDVAAERTLAAPRASLGLTIGADVWAPGEDASSPHSDGAALDRALTLVAVGGAPHVGWRLAAAVPRGISLLLPPFLLVVLFEPATDWEEPLGRLTLGGVLSSVHSCSRSSQSSGPAMFPDWGRGGEGGREGPSEPATEPVQGVWSRQVIVLLIESNACTFF